MTKKEYFTIDELFDMSDVPWYERVYYAVKRGVSGSIRNIKYGWQRVTKGYDDLAWWSMDMYLSELIVKLSKELRTNSHGVPVLIYSELGFTQAEDGGYSEEEQVSAKKLWDNILSEIEEGFNQYLEVDNCMLHPDFQLEKFHKAFELLHKYFSTLWD